MEWGLILAPKLTHKELGAQKVSFFFLKKKDE
jgi:hypothetical protein